MASSVTSEYSKMTSKAGSQKKIAIGVDRVDSDVSNFKK